MHCNTYYSCFANKLTKAFKRLYNKAMSCNLCPRQCKTDRIANFGFCGKTNIAEISKVMIHEGEEPFLTKHNKSGAIFFAGCNLKCVYCQNYQISNGSGKQISPQILANLFVQLEKAGAENIDLVTPTHYADAIIAALKIYKPKIPVIYNCGGYESTDKIIELCKYIDIFLFDLKYYDNTLAVRYSSAPNYFEYATKAILAAIKHKKNIWQNEILLQGVAIRHLVLPTHTDDSVKILDWINNNIPTTSPISIMSQYIPYGKADKYPEINRKIKPIEYKIVLNFAKNMKNQNIFIQEVNSATECMIPDFTNGDSKFTY